MVRLVAEQTAAPTASSSFPQWRVFDPYFGHSWASGYGQFDDGNNQESSSEAINAWNALALWSSTVNDTQLAAQSEWMLSRETRAARVEWTQPDVSNFSEFNHRSIGVNWGGKRDYATFFSAEAAAVFGNQLIPLSLNMTASLSEQAADINATLSTVVPDGNHARQFGDYLLMYRSLADRNGALTAAQSMPPKNIDDGNSRTYMLAWIMNQSNQQTYQYKLDISLLSLGTDIILE